MRSDASTVAEYLKAMPEDRRTEISKVRDVVLKNLPDGYVEGMNWGMICYEIPLRVYPNTYNKQPLGCAALAMQKHYCALYLSCVYQDSKQLAQLKKAFADAGKRLDMGKSCIRFKQADDLPLPAIGKIIAATTVKMIETYETARTSGRGKC